MKRGKLVVKKAPAQYEIRLPSHTENLEIIREFVFKIITRVGINEEDASKIELAVDEACTNVMKHAYGGESTNPIDVAIKIDYKKVTIVVTDHGKGFNPKLVEIPNMKEYLAEMRVGGLGIYLMRSLMDEVTYDVKPGISNKVTMVKFLVKDDQVVEKKNLRSGVNHG